MHKKKKPLIRLDLTATVGHESSQASSSWMWIAGVVIVGLAVCLIWFGLSQ